MSMVNSFFFVGSLSLLTLVGASEAGEKLTKTSSTWQNPNIGLNLDGVIGLDDAEGPWKSPGLTLRGAELIVSANIDPYAFLLGNVLLTEHGAELHEAFSEFPYLPINLKTKLGKMLANFGHWNLYHVHSMPFTTEPRIYREYAGGMLALTGIELSWMLPVDHFIELTLSAYDRFEGHTHDSDPSANVLIGKTKSLDEIAAQIGARKHGSHWHGANGEIMTEEDLLALAETDQSIEPVVITGNRRIPGFAYGGKLSTVFELGPHISLDMSGSAIYQHEYKKSRRPELDGHTYSKLLYDAALILYWHPMTENNYRNLQVGAEMLGSYEGFERVSDEWIFEDYFNRIGVFSWLAWRLSQRWQFGGFAEIFQANIQDADLKKRFGGFVTLNISHYQYLRVEYTRYQYPGLLDGVNLVRLQYDATIGYHSHGRQR